MYTANIEQRRVTQSDSEPVSLAIRIGDVTVSYGREVAVNQVSLEIPRCQITALIGPSGCGKTSLLSSLNRLTDLIPGCRVSGKILVDGHNVLDASTDVVQLRRQVGMIFQRPNPFPFSIRQNLELPLREHGLRYRQTLDERIEQSLKEVGLWNEVKDRLDRPALALSGGQQQRLCLARAIVLRPEILLLDEPCSALDPVSTNVIEELMKQIRNRYTLVLVTHNLGQARRVADRTALLWSDGTGGRLIECDQTSRLFDGPQHELTAEYLAGRIG